jgi:4-amino-4-deoxy-L-arabinose transferase-like glycosyltransferase
MIKKYPYLLFLIAVSIVVNLFSLSTDIFIGDSAVYASISKIMVVSDNYFDLKTINAGHWLDKPHFPFWIWALSMNIFGISSFAYKLPALLFFLLSLLYTFLFAKDYYGQKIALVAVLILSSTLHIIIGNTDVRAEPFLMGLLLGSVYHFMRVFKNPRFIDILLGSVWAASAIMTKGIFVLIPIFSGVLGQAVFTREIHRLFKLRWLFVLVLIGVFIIPELYALNVQFSKLQHEQIHGQENVNYIKFFFWDSQFGRFFNTGPITRSGGNVLFYVPVLLWSFAPWSILLFTYLFKRKKRFKEYYSLSISAITFLLFSFSSFQVEHYIDIIFPFLAIIVADFSLSEWKEKSSKRMSIIQYVQLSIFTVGMLVIYLFAQPERSFIFILILGVFGGLVYYILQLNKNSLEGALYLSSVVFIGIGLFLNLVFTPMMLQYQSTVVAAKFINKNYEEIDVGFYGIDPHLFHYYLENELICKSGIHDYLVADSTKLLLFVSHQYLKELDERKAPYELVKAFDEFDIIHFKPKFLVSSQRKSILKQCYLVEIDRNSFNY